MNDIFETVLDFLIDLLSFPIKKEDKFKIRYRRVLSFIIILLFAIWIYLSFIK